MNLWQRKLDAYLHDPPEKVLDLAWHQQRAQSYERGLALDDVEFHRPCDHMAAAADRLPWPTYRALSSSFDGRENCFRHPLGEADFKIDPFPSADLAHDFGWVSKPQLAEGDERAQFLAFWRLWRWWASDRDDARLAFLPAETRIPDHTIWAHNSMVSAFQACVGDNGAFRPAFLLFQMGPVQDYIAQARRTLDLWSGSYLLSYLIGCGLRRIALTIGPDNVIFPNLCGQPIFDLLLKDEVWMKARVQEEKSGSTLTLWDTFGYERNAYARLRLLTPSLPNRFLAVLPAEKAADIAREVADVIRATHKRIAEAVWTWGAKNLHAADCWSDDHRKRFDAQNERFLDISWQVLPWPTTPEKAYEMTAVLPEAGLDECDRGPRAGLRTVRDMACRQARDDRDVRNFVCARDARGWKDKSKLADDAKLDNPGAAWSALYRLADWQLDAVRRTRAWKAWTDGGWKAGMELAKDALNGKEENLLDLRGTQDAEKLAETLNRAVAGVQLFKRGEILGATSLVKRLWPMACLEPWHGFERRDWRMPDTRSIALGLSIAAGGGEEDGGDEEQRYFAVLALDGDEVGKWVSGTHCKMPKLRTQLSRGALEYMQREMADLLGRKRPLSPSFHLQFSEMLANFGHYCAGRIVEASGGRLIYAGGDDVLALLPAHKALSCATALRAAFRGDPEPLRALRSMEDKALFDFEQPGFVKLHQDAPCSEGEPKRFHAMVPGPAADCSAGIAMAHFKSPLQDVVRAAQRAEKRAKGGIKDGGLDRSAVAVTLMKRSGETIEWGCKWAGGGLEAFDGMLSAIAKNRVSAKFPHRIVELVNGYRVSGKGTMGGTTPAAEFETVVDEVLLRDIALAVERQWGEADGSKDAAQALRVGLERYIKSIDGVREKVEGLIGLCQTAAFVARNLSGRDRAERQGAES